MSGASAVADATRVVLQNAGEPYRVEHPDTRPERSTVILVAPDALRELLAEFDERSADREPEFPVRSIPLSAAASLGHRSLRQALAHPCGGPIGVEETALALVRHVLAQGGKGPREAVPDPPGSRRRDTRRRELAEAVQHLLARRYAEPLSLSEIGREVGASPFHLTRVFRAHTGVPIHRYLTRLRLRMALDMLGEPHPELARVALDVGFSTHSHFTHAFRTEFGFPPREVADGKRAGR